MATLIILAHPGLSAIKVIEESVAIVVRYIYNK